MKRFAVCSPLVVLILFGLCASLTAQTQTVVTMAAGASTSDQQSGTTPNEKAQRTYHKARFPIGIDQIPDEDRARMPHPYGLAINYFGSTEKYLLKSADVSINGNPIPSQEMSLDSVTTVVNAYTMVGDLWVLPYFDFYLLGGPFNGKTKNIKASLLDPNFPPIPIPQSISFNGDQYGFGGTLSGAYKQLFFCYDWNISWARVSGGNGRIPSWTQGPRLGMELGSKQVPVDIYVGAMKETVSGSQKGSISFPGIGTFVYDVQVAPQDNWNYVLGTSITVKKAWEFDAEYGFGRRHHQMLQIVHRFP